MTDSNLILVADDEPAIRRLLRTILTTQGYAVTEAADGINALQTALLTPNADLLLLDLAMPGMDGLQIIRELRASGSAVPIIVLSNRGDENAKVAALDSGAARFSPDSDARSSSAASRRRIWIACQSCQLLGERSP